MENRAPYVLIGSFVIAAIAAVFGFVYWMHNTAGLQARSLYRIRFENTVSGLLSGAAVLFNGIRVGEVTDLRLDPEDPLRVTVTIAVATGTPVRADTHVGLDFQGLTGTPVVTLQGGTPGGSPWTAPPDGVPMLVAEPAAGQSMTQAAREALRHLDTLLTENAEPLRNTVANLNTFSGALARNSDRLDGIVAGIERLTGAAPTKAAPIYDLTAVRMFPTLNRPPRGQLVVPEPTASITLDSQRILVRTSGAEGPAAGAGQWSDNLPKLFQQKVVQSFENANYLQAVARPLEGLFADYQLLLDIRKFELTISADAPVADVEFSAKILGDKGRIVNARIFHAIVHAEVTDASGAAAALDEAFGKAATELVLWTSEVM
jgi:phospholipid/cholesterol/gamma-HCH transport system substrate-binding protein